MSDAPQQAAEAVKPLEFTPIEEVTAGETAEVKPVNEQTATEQAIPAAETAETSSAEPVSAGVLGYKAPGLLKQFKFSKRYFWFGNEAVSHENLTSYLRGTEAKVAQPNAAWSSHTGKGLLYMSKTDAEKSHPQEILALADVTDLVKIALDEFSFKIHGEKHTFKAANETERGSWYTAIEKAIPEAKESKEAVHGSDKYQETVKHLGAGPAATTAGVATAAKPVEKEETKEAAEAPITEEAPLRSNSATDDETKADKKETKSRSVSRGKRTSIFGAFKGKKEEHNVKVAEKQEEKAEAKEEEKQAIEAPATEEVTVPAVAAAAEDVKIVEAEESVKTDATKSKRSSIFGSIYQKVRSPTVEKKESEALAPVVPPKDDAAPVSETTASADVPEAAVAAEGSKIAEPTPVAAGKTEEKMEATKPKSNFLGGLVERVRAKSPSSRKAEEKKDVVSSSEAPAVPPKDEPVAETAVPAAKTEIVNSPVADTAKTEESAPEAAAAAAATTSPKEGRRRSYFGGFGQKKDKSESENESEKPAGKFSSMFRKPSQMSRSTTSEKLNKKENVVPESTVQETAETRPKAVTEAETKPIESNEPKNIDDNVPEAVAVGEAPQSNPAVSAAA